LKKPRAEPDLEHRIGSLMFRLMQTGKQIASAVSQFLARLSEPPRSVALLSQTDKKTLCRILKDLVDGDDPGRNAESATVAAANERYGGEPRGVDPRDASLVAAETP
jgi:hypothetical protein